jgi:hypothetical protein
MAYINRISWTLADVSVYIASQFFIQLSRQGMHEILKRDSRVKSCRGIPMGEKRTEGTEDTTLEFFRTAIKAIDGVSSHFVFNIDEMRHQDWVDRGQQTCVVPAADHEDYVYMPVSRAGKRITLMACIVTDVSAIKPQIIVPRKTIDDDLVLT